MVLLHGNILALQHGVNHQGMYLILGELHVSLFLRLRITINCGM
jgi:hypothetical protein